MGALTKIEWTDHTMNPWWGCVRVSPACTFCYAADLDKRYSGADAHWGKESRRRFFGDKHWNEPLKWNREAENTVQTRFVFCASMADVFEQLPQEHPDTCAMTDARARLWALIYRTPYLTWLLLTKRPENVFSMVPTAWEGRWPSNCWLGVTAEDQERTDERLRHLWELIYVRGTEPPILFLSMEPLFEAVTLPDWFLMRGERAWVINGGESGPHARVADPNWYRGVREQCADAGVPYFFKQFGEWIPQDQTRYLPNPHDAYHFSCASAKIDDDRIARRVGKKIAGRLLDGVEHNGRPLPVLPGLEVTP